MVYGRDWYVNANNQKIGVRTYEPYQYMLREWAPTQLHNLSVTGKADVQILTCRWAIWTKTV